MSLEKWRFPRARAVVTQAVRVIVFAHNAVTNSLKIFTIPRHPRPVVNGRSCR